MVIPNPSFFLKDELTNKRVVFGAIFPSTELANPGDQLHLKTCRLMVILNFSKDPIILKNELVRKRIVLGRFFGQQVIIITIIIIFFIYIFIYMKKQFCALIRDWRDGTEGREPLLKLWVY